VSSTIEILLSRAGLEPVDERLYEQIRRAVLWIAGDTAGKLRSKPEWLRVLQGTASIARRAGLVVARSYRLPPFEIEVYKDYLSRAAAALELADPRYMGEAMGLRNCLRGNRVNAYDVLLEALEDLEASASKLSKNCGIGLETSLLVVFTAASGVLNGVKNIIGGELKPSTPALCPLCGRKPVLLAGDREAYTAICGFCGLSWRLEGEGLRCPACGSERVEELASLGGDRVYRCSSCGNIFLYTERSLGEALEPVAMKTLLAVMRRKKQ